jgi:hypothetical protein
LVKKRQIGNPNKKNLKIKNPEIQTKMSILFCFEFPDFLFGFPDFCFDFRIFHFRDFCLDFLDILKNSRQNYFQTIRYKYRHII